MSAPSEQLTADSLATRIGADSELTKQRAVSLFGSAPNPLSDKQVLLLALQDLLVRLGLGELPVADLVRNLSNFVSPKTRGMWLSILDMRFVMLQCKTHLMSPIYDIMNGGEVFEIRPPLVNIVIHLDQLNIRVNTKDS